MTQEEKTLRANSQRLKKLHITTAADRKPYVFISYKSDDWREVLEDIVYRMQKEYGLRVYYDRDFDRSNKDWYITMQQNMRRRECLCVLAFFSQGYVSSYATMMELLSSQGNKAALTAANKNVKPVIPIFLPDPDILKRGEPLSVDAYISEALNALDDMMAPVGISGNEWSELQKMISDCCRDSGIAPAAVVTACQMLGSLKEAGDLNYETVSDAFRTMKNVIAKHTRVADNNDLFYSNLAETIQDEQKSVYTTIPDMTVFDESLRCLEDMRLPTTNKQGEFVSPEAAPTKQQPSQAVQEKETSVQIKQEEIPSAPEKKKEKAAAPKKDAVVPAKQEIALPEPYSGSGNQATLSDVRQRLSEETQALAFRQFRESMPRGGKAAIDYVMAAVLGGCNQVTVNSPVWQINYYTQAVATLDSSKKKGTGLGATWTWSSNCRKLLGLEGAGAIPAHTNSYFKTLPEDTALDWLEQRFIAQDPEHFRTKKPELVLIALRKLMEFMEH